MTIDQERPLTVDRRSLLQSAIEKACGILALIEIAALLYRAPHATAKRLDAIKNEQIRLVRQLRHVRDYLDNECGCAQQAMNQAPAVGPFVVEDQPHYGELGADEFGEMMG